MTPVGDFKVRIPRNQISLFELIIRFGCGRYRHPHAEQGRKFALDPQPGMAGKTDVETGWTKAVRCDYVFTVCKT